MTLIVAADTGGTFTDLAAYDRETGQLTYTKSLTTYGDLVDGVMDCVRKAGVRLEDADLVKFGTTLVINTFIQRNGARTALVCTRGHTDTLELRRGNRPNPFDLRYERDPVLVERDLRLAVNERVGGQGEVIRPIDESEIEALADRLSELKVDSVAISFLNSYGNPSHEERVAQMLRARLPGLYITAGTELTREWYEYERTSTAAANAYVGPRLNDYVKRLDGALREKGFGKTFYLMASNGGVFSVERARQQPVMLVESGPVGGCIGASVYAQRMGRDKVIAFDMGGTTAKCAVVENGRFEVKSPYYVGGTVKGFPVRGAVLDIVEVGAGGGSIAWIDAHGRLGVGPKSAGSDPGPVAYGRGGAEPTITDANLVLGRIGAASFLGGEMGLDEAGARNAIEHKLAGPLGFASAGGIDELAQGILTLGSATMADAIKQITIERGLDPREFSLFAFGGGGPLHSAALARELNIPEVIIPPEPGIFSAIGMLLADARVDEAQTFLRPLTDETTLEMLTAFETMEAGMQSALSRELAAPTILFERQAMIRFRGQRHSMRTLLGAAVSAEDVRTEFENQYRRRYGFVEPGAPIEIVSLVLTAMAHIDRPALEKLTPAINPDAGAKATTRLVYFAEAGGRLETPVYRRSALAPGFSASGPAIIEEYGSTTVVGPNDRFEIGDLGEIRIRFN